MEEIMEAIIRNNNKPKNSLISAELKFEFL